MLMQSLTFILRRQDLVDGIFPVKDVSVEAQLVVEGFLWILKMRRKKKTKHRLNQLSQHIGSWQRENSQVMLLGNWKQG